MTGRSSAPPLHVWALTVVILGLVLAGFAAAFLVVDDPFQWLLVSSGTASIG